MDDSLLIEERGPVLWLTLNRPEAMNALSPAMIATLDGAIGRAGTDERVHCVVITGVGRAFCAGADLKAVRRETGADPGALRRFLELAAGTMMEHRDAGPGGIYARRSTPSRVRGYLIAPAVSPRTTWRCTVRYRKIGSREKTTPAASSWSSLIVWSVMKVEMPRPAVYMD